jgi:hypothetical protein
MRHHFLHPLLSWQSPLDWHIDYARGTSMAVVKVQLALTQQTIAQI